MDQVSRLCAERRDESQPVVFCSSTSKVSIFANANHISVTRLLFAEATLHLGLLLCDGVHTHI